MLFFIVFSLFLTTNAQKLVLVTVVHRHGDRTPEYVYPTDPYPEDMWHGLGQLTAQGEKQLYSLGRYMKERYAGFLPRNYIQGDVYVESSDMPRTIESARACLNGLYEFDNIVNGPMQPIHTIPSDLDNKILFSKPCPKMDQLKEEAIHNNIPEETLEKYDAVLKELSEHVGEDIGFDNIGTAFLIADTLNIESSKGMVVPDWAENFVPDPLSSMAKLFVYKLPFSTVELKRLYCGPLLKDILMHLQIAASGRSSLKLMEYSGHDTTVARILSCLNVFDGNPPDYGDAVFIELYKNANIRYEVLVSYKSGDVVKALTIPGCSLFCPLDIMITLLSSVVPGDWDAECEA